MRDNPRGRWTVIHLLNRCRTDHSSLYDEGLINFFLDDPLLYEAVIAVPSPDAQQALLKALRSSLVWRLHQPRYNTIARPQSPDFQNSNQWLLELTVAALARGAVNSRSEAQQHAPVSYTHLDVYKRQLGSCSRNGPTMKPPPAMTALPVFGLPSAMPKAFWRRLLTAPNTSPVSYTHLDVYKRQERRCNACGTQRWRT